MDTTNKQYQANRLAGYERTSAIIWLLISIIQIMSIYLMIAGVWNLFAAMSFFKLEKKILNRDADVPQIYESITELIIIAIINILFGGIFGIILVGFNFWIRSEILAHRDIFDNINGVNTDNIKIPSSIRNYEQLEKLYKLKEKGILTDDEYNKEKNRLIRGA